MIMYQWDLNKQIEVSNSEVKEVHFSNALTATALKVEVKNGYANVPNTLLQEPLDIDFYWCCDDCVVEAGKIDVIKRAKPDDYIYTEEEIKRYEDLEKRIKKLEILIPTPYKNDVGKTLEVEYIGVDENADRVYGYRLTGTAHNDDNEPDIEIPLPDGDDSGIMPIN